MEFGNGIAIDGAGNAYVTGTTKSSNFPTTSGAFDRSANIPANCPRCASDHTDGFVFKLNASGSALTYSTYLGGTDIDSPRGITVDGSGSAYVVGEELGSDFPTTAGAFRRTSAGDYDMFVTKLNATGSALTYSTLLGGTLSDNGQGIAVDAGGNAYALGFSGSTNFPTTPGAFDTTANGGFDATVTKLNPAGSALVYSTYLGGAGFDNGSDVALDGGGDAYIAGGTGSTDFPTTPGAFDTTSDGSDGFVTKLNPSGSAAVYSTVLGGSASDSATGIVLDTSGNAWLSGSTTSADFPVSADAADGSFNGGSDAIIAELNASGSALPYATFLGGSQSDGASDIGRDSAGNLYITGSTQSRDFPATTGAFDTVWNGDPTIFWGDAFVTKLSLTGGTTPPAPPPVPDGAHAPGARQRLQPGPARRVRLERRDRCGDLQHPDRRLERVHRAARPRRIRHGVELLHRRARHHDAVLARPRRQHGRHAGCLVGGSQLHATGGAASDGAHEPGRQPVHGRGRGCLERNRDRERGGSGHDGRLALEQQHRGRERACERDRSDRRLHRHVHDHDVRRGGQHDRHDHGLVQRHEPDGPADRDARGRSAAGAGAAGPARRAPTAWPADRVHRASSRSRAPLPRAAPRCRSPAPTAAWPACPRA